MRDLSRATERRLIVMNGALTIVIEDLLALAETHESVRLRAAIDLLTQASEELSYVIEPE